ncbi:Cupredoxin, partial [Mycena epipterygia]
VTNAFVAPDGFNRSAIQMGEFPGAHLFAQKGDVLHINVSNALHDPTMRRSTSIHWHGIFQDRTASEDGPAFVNQCPIAPGMFYEYNYPLLNQTGTYWFHSHLSTQYVDGERGVLVIYPNDPLGDLYDVDDDSTIITLADWYHEPAEQLMDQYKLDGVTPPPASGLVNGIGRYIGGPEIPWAVVNVVQGKRYLSSLRFVNTSGFAAFIVSIDGHTMDIIETDGIETVPLTVSSFEIHVAQRYSAILTANNAVNNYWINAPMVVNINNVKAILRYAGAPDADPHHHVPHPFLFNSNYKSLTRLQTLVDPGAPNGANPPDHVIDLKFDTVWEINGIVYTPPTLPTLLKIINGATVASDFNISEHTFILKKNEVVQLNIHGSDHGALTFLCLSGHAFDIVQSASGPLNFVNPPRRDVISVEQGGVSIQFRADNPGPWFLHCHIDWHLEAGLAVVFAEAPEDQRTGPQAEIITPQWLDLCPAYYALPLGTCACGSHLVYGTHPLPRVQMSSDFPGCCECRLKYFLHIRCCNILCSLYWAVLEFQGVDVDLALSLYLHMKLMYPYLVLNELDSDLSSTQIKYLLVHHRRLELNQSPRPGERSVSSLFKEKRITG